MDSLHPLFIYKNKFGVTKKIDLRNILNDYNPLNDCPARLLDDIFKEAAKKASELKNLSNKEQAFIEFCQKIAPNKFTQSVKYKTNINNIHPWEIELTPEGIFYWDKSFYYGQREEPYHQWFTDYWFYGPLMPITELQMRKSILTHISKTFIEPSNNLHASHFKLYDYPQLSNYPMWEDGDHVNMDFIYIRNYGIDYGNKNWHDGPNIGYLSFEHCLNITNFDNAHIKKIKDKVYNEFLAKYFL